MIRSNVFGYCILVGVTALVLLGVKHLSQYIFSSTVDWNIAIGIVAIALPVFIQVCSGIIARQKENQNKIEQIESVIGKILFLEESIKVLDQTQAALQVIEDRIVAVEEENRRQERFLARIDAVLETVIQQEQLHSRVDKLQETIASMQSNKKEEM